MALLIDGYNLLHVTGLFGRGPASFEQSRAALLGFLAAAIDANERPRTIVVFDASAAPPGLPNEYNIAGIHVHFARDYDSADELLEELIAAHHTPKKLTVVSSDHRVQRAAKRRKANAVDSHAWYHETAERLKKRKKSARELPDAKPDVPLTKGEVEVWLRIFGPIEVDEQELLSPPLAHPAPTPKKQTKRAKGAKPAPRASRAQPGRVDEVSPTRPRVRKAVKRATKSRKPPDLGFGDIQNPFPPGYAEDVD